MRKFWAFLKRDFLQEASYRLSFVFQVYGIVFGAALFYFVAQLFPAQIPALAPYGTTYFPFVLVGLSFQGLMQSGMTSYAASIRQGQMLGTLEAMLVTPTSLPTIVTASALWAYLRASLNMALYLAVGVALGADFSHANILGAATILVLSVVAFSALGILSAAFTLAYKRGDPVASIFGNASALLGGTYFPVEVLPPWLRPVAELIPLRHALEGMRGALLRGQGPLALWREEAVLGLLALVLLPAAVWAFRLAVRKAKRDGSLAQY